MSQSAPPPGEVYQDIRNRNALAIAGIALGPAALALAAVAFTFNGIASDIYAHVLYRLTDSLYAGAFLMSTFALGAAVPGVVFSHRAMRHSDYRGLAIAGIVLNYCAIGFAVLNFMISLRCKQHHKERVRVTAQTCPQDSSLS